MRFNTNDLITDLRQRTEENIQRAENLSRMEMRYLLARPSENKWNALECIEHLLRYGDFYIPEIKSRIQKSKPSVNPEFKSSWLGNYFAEAVAPIDSNKRAKKMNTLKEMNTLGAESRPQTLLIFIEQQKEILAILKLAQNYDLQKVKTAISISKLIKLRLGDTLRVVIYHNRRHLNQAEMASKSRN